jgi:hypothetical protein
MIEKACEVLRKLDDSFILIHPYAHPNLPSTQPAASANVVATKCTKYLLCRYGTHLLSYLRYGVLCTLGT